MSQEYEKLLNEFQLPKTFFGFSTFSLCNNDLVVYCDCGKGRTHIKLSFEDVIAYMLHDEFSHPNMEQSFAPPRSENSSCYYPALEIRNSEWKATFSDYRLQGDTESVRHYQFLSSSNILDVMFKGQFKAKRITSEELLEIEDMIDTEHSQINAEA